MADKWYLGKPMVDLLALIRKHEAGPRGYNADFGNDDHWVLTTKTFDQARAFGRTQVSPQNEASSAIGGYQIITSTMDMLKSRLRLSGQEMFDESGQDDLAVALMNGRGFMHYMRGEISAEDFANGLAKEWASLPVVTPIKGKRGIVLTPGQSYYAGDGLNKASVTVAEIMPMVRLLRTMPMDDQVPPPDGSVPVSDPMKWIGVIVITVIAALIAAKALGVM